MQMPIQYSEEASAAVVAWVARVEGGIADGGGGQNSRSGGSAQEQRLAFSTRERRV